MEETEKGREKNRNYQEEEKETNKKEKVQEKKKVGKRDVSVLKAQLTYHAFLLKCNFRPPLTLRPSVHSLI